MLLIRRLTSTARELLTLSDAAGRLVEAVEYDDAPPWPREPDGGGGSQTLELIHPELDRNNPFAWLPSDRAGGTPGAANSAAGGDVDLDDDIDGGGQ